MERSRVLDVVAGWLTRPSRSCTGHVADDPSFAYDLARAHHFAGIMYTVIGEVMEDFAFSDKTESGAPVGPGNMSSVFDHRYRRISSKAITSYESLGNADRAVAAKAMRARAHQSRAIWDVINPTASGTFTTVNASAAAADAQCRAYGRRWEQCGH